MYKMDDGFAELDQAFQRQLQNGKLRFLDDLKYMIVSDSKLAKEYKHSITSSFKLMRQFIGRNYESIDTITLKDWEVFGISHPDILHRIGYLSIHYESMFSEELRRSTLSDCSDTILHPSFSLMDDAFQNGIRQGRVAYLHQLCDFCKSDFELEGDIELINKAFKDMITFIGEGCDNPNDSSVILSFTTSHPVIPLEETLSLKDWEQFGLSIDLSHRIGYLAYCLSGPEDDTVT